MTHLFEKFNPRMDVKMKITEFAEITRRVIHEQGFSEFQPSACFPARREIRALAGVPMDVPHERAAMEWALKTAQADEELLVAFRHSESEFKVIRVAGENRAEQIFQVA